MEATGYDGGRCNQTRPFPPSPPHFHFNPHRFQLSEQLWGCNVEPGAFFESPKGILQPTWSLVKKNAEIQGHNPTKNPIYRLPPARR